MKSPWLTVLIVALVIYLGVVFGAAELGLFDTGDDEDAEDFVDGADTTTDGAADDTSGDAAASSDLAGSDGADLGGDDGGDDE